MKSIKRTAAFKCSDDKIFLNKKEATLHQKNIAYATIDFVMKKYSLRNPKVHYPNLSISLVPFMRDNATELIEALKLAL